MKILAFDPGKTTGVCACEVDLVTGTIDIVGHRTILWENRFYIQKVVELFPAGKIIIEDYNVFTKDRKMIVANTSYMKEVFRIIGVIEASVYSFYGNTENILLRPSVKQGIKRGAPPVLSQHEKSAYYHIRTYVLDIRKQMGILR